MPEPTDVMITTPFYQLQQELEVSRFLKIKPLALGILEILISLLGLGLTIWKKSYFVIWSPIIFTIIGAILVSAAHTRKPRLVKISQMMSYVSFVVVAVSFRGHLVYALTTPDAYFYAFLASDILIFIITLAVAVTSCSCSCCCCCKPKSTPVMVTYVTTAVPVDNNMGQPGPSVVVQPVNSVMYVLPAAHGSFPPVPLPNYDHVPSAAPPMYCPVPTTPPSNYDKVSAAPPPNYSPIPCAPTPAYEHEDFQTRR